jgi:type VI secretion system protein VasD
MWEMKSAVSGLAVLLGVALAACGGAPPPPPTVAAVAIAAAADVNPDASGQPAPVAVRVYQLASTAAFERADFFDLRQNDQAVLGADMLGRDEFLITPGGSQQLSVEMKPGAKYIGVVAAFRDIQRANWRATAAPPANQTTAVRVTIQGLNVSVAMAPPGSGS